MPDDCRVAVGYGTVGFFLFLAVVLVWILPRPAQPL
jgi:hypothetical protein